MMMRAAFCLPNISSVCKTDGLAYRIREIVTGRREDHGSQVRGDVEKRIPQSPPFEMKTLTLTLIATAAVVFLGACDKHSFEKTKVLHEKYSEHGAGAAHEGGHAEAPKPRRSQEGPLSRTATSN